MNTGQTTVLQGKEEQPMAKSGGTSPKAHRPPMRKEAESPTEKETPHIWLGGTVTEVETDGFSPQHTQKKLQFKKKAYLCIVNR